MALLQSELKIVEVKKLFSTKLVLPSYQRPYRWTVHSSNRLFMDTYEAFKNGIHEYRLGSVIFHKESTNRYKIVDGQQRLTTLSILLYCLGIKDINLLRESYSKLSTDAVVMNYRMLIKRINELPDDEKERYRDYLLNQCTTVQIVTDSEQEAFQFFDSQNSRGKELAPHDLLKSYHLREMNGESESRKVKIVNAWENTPQEQLVDLFRSYLYPVLQWSSGRNGIGYSTGKIHIFKGIRSSNVYNYTIYHKASNLFVEQFNESGSNELLAAKKLNQFQLTQPIIAGKRFFAYTLHYGKLLEQVQKKITSFFNKEELPEKRSGDIYIKQLYECSLLLFVDRFGVESLSASVMQQLYSWSYSLRMVMNAVYPQTINKYAVGDHERVNEGLDMFQRICEMNDPEELKLIVLQRPESDIAMIEKYRNINDLLCKWNGW